MVQLSGAMRLTPSPVAWTPASVRPAACATVGRPKSRPSTRSNSIWTDRPAGWRCQPTKPVPSNCSVARKVRLIGPESSRARTLRQVAQILVPFDKRRFLRVRFQEHSDPIFRPRRRDRHHPPAPGPRRARPRPIAVGRKGRRGLRCADAGGGHVGRDRGAADGTSGQGRDAGRGRRRRRGAAPRDGAGDAGRRSAGGYLRDRRRAGGHAQSVHRGRVRRGWRGCLGRQARQSQLHLAQRIGRRARGAGHRYRAAAVAGAGGVPSGGGGLPLCADLSPRYATRRSGAAGAGRRHHHEPARTAGESRRRLAAGHRRLGRAPRAGDGGGAAPARGRARPRAARRRRHGRDQPLRPDRRLGGAGRRRAPVAAGAGAVWPGLRRARAPRGR